MDLTLVQLFVLCILVAFVAALYASVGHGGASGYLAVMSFLLLDPALMSTTALLLNVLVAGMGTIQFARAGHFSWKLAWPFIVLSIPLAFVGGLMMVSEAIYMLLLAAVLLFAAYRLIRGATPAREEPLILPPRMVALLSGSGIGLLSGIVGVGGGIFLSPVLILMRWATTKQAAAVSALFIVVNSVAGLAGRFARGGLEAGTIWPLILAAGAGGLLGSSWGARRSTPRTLRLLLGIVLLGAAFKLIVYAVA